MEIDAKVALVTGAASGIGRATALALAREGARIAVADVDEQAGGAVVAAIEQAGGDAGFIRTDVTTAADLDAAVAFAEQRWGGLDILHNNAGIIVPTRPFDEADRATWRKMVDINFTGMLLCAHAAIPALRRRGGGAIVNTASIAAVIVYPGNPVYAATKAGILGFTRALAPLAEEAGIRVNCICPERVDTPLLRGAMGGADPRSTGVPVMEVETVAEAVLDIIRDDSLAGQAIKISPGPPPERLEFPNFGVVR